jgi:amino-acid N-acetyltransferase
MRKQQNSFGVHVASGNYVAAKRRGVVKGVDYGETGEVRFVDVDSISRQLQLNNVVVLSNLGYSAAGEVLNCHTYEVATVAAIQLQADKVVCMLDDVAMERVEEMCMGMRALPLIAAEKLLNQFAQQHEMKMHNLREKKLQAKSVDASTNGGGEHKPILKHESFQQDAVQATGGAEWYRDGCPVEMCTAIAMCRRGVQRVHLVSALTDGKTHIPPWLLLELYTRDGVIIKVVIIRVIIIIIIMIRSNYYYYT